MLLIAGRYVRNKMLPPTTDRCSRCHNVAQINWHRHYKTFHFFFFPMFSYGEQVMASCGVCGYTVLGRHPYPLPALGFLDRMGFLVPFIVLGGGLLGSCVLLGAVAATAPPPPPPTAEHEARLHVDENLELGKAWGEGPNAQVLADAVLAELVTDEKFQKSDVGVAVQVTEQHRVFVDVQYMNLSEMKPEPRVELARHVMHVLEPKLQDGDHVVVGVKGVLLYGIVMHGDLGHDWDIQAGTQVTSADVEKALKAAGTASPAASVSVSASASATASPQPPVASASAAPPTSPSAAPAKKKKKKPAKPMAPAAE